MKVKYVGPSPSVMAGREGYVILFEHGVATDVADDWGASLCEQDTFEQVKTKKADPAAATAQEAD